MSNIPNSLGWLILATQRNRTISAMDGQMYIKMKKK